MSPPTHHLITLLRSPHGLPSKISRTLESLSLYKLHQSVLYPFHPTLSGKLLEVKELIGVRNVDQAEGERLMFLSKKGGQEKSGLKEIGKAWGGGKSLGDQIGPFKGKGKEGEEIAD